LRKRPFTPLVALAGSLFLLVSGAAAAAGPDDALYAELLGRYTRESPDLAGTRVDYRGLAAEPDWRKLISQLEQSDPGLLKTKAEKLAFWINAYNILAIQTVLSGYPLESIRDLGSFFSPVWKREAGEIGGQPVTLHEIEHEILRPMREPRIHAAIVCASTSCPSLSRKPFTARDIDTQLTAAFRRFLADTGKGMRIDRGEQELWLSSIFDWFEEDWEAQGGVLKAIIEYAPIADQDWLRENADELDVEHFDYDWGLNDSAGRY
jgi:hypothetical protein